MYNYPKYLDQMARWKMNLIIGWSKRVPANAAAVQEYAARRGIHVVWGYSWGTSPVGT